MWVTVNFNARFKPHRGLVVHDLVFYISQFSHTLLLFMILCLFYMSQFSHTLLLFMILCSISASSLIHWCCSWSCVLYQPVLSHTVVVHDLVFCISQFSHTLVLFMILCSVSANSLTHCCRWWSCVLYQPVLSHTGLVFAWWCGQSGRVFRGT